jgi:hypothetical protein
MIAGISKLTGLDVVAFTVAAFAFAAGADGLRDCLAMTSVEFF